MDLLPGLLSKFVRNGKLIVKDRYDRVATYGSGENGPTVTIKLHDQEVENEIFYNPELKTAEAYMDGRLTVEEGGKIFDLLYLFSVNRSGLGSHPVQHALRTGWRKLRRLQQMNPIGLAEKNIRHHYDIEPSFYAKWLDATMTYSCAFYPTPETSLEDAQIAKLRRIASKLMLKPGMRVAEIGSGWGALATFLARNYDVHVTSVSLSPEQIGIAKARAEREGVDHLVDFIKMDYRHLGGTYDRVVSIAMMEAIGVSEFDTYFNKLKSLAAPDGFSLVHCIGRMSPPGTTAPFIRKYIFPGGYVPALSEVFAAVERSGLWCCDMETWRLHYYWTIKHWRENYEKVRAETVQEKGEKFARMWDFYLASVELGFLHGSNFVFHLLLAEKRDAVPVVRDYMMEEERRLVAINAR